MRLLSSIIVLTVTAAVFAADPPAKPLTVADAAKKVGEKVTVEFEVKSVGGGKGIAFLNSEADFKSAQNFTLPAEGGHREVQKGWRRGP